MSKSTSPKKASQPPLAGSHKDLLAKDLVDSARKHYDDFKKDGAGPTPSRQDSVSDAPDKGSEEKNLPLNTEAWYSKGEVQGETTNTQPINLLDIKLNREFVAFLAAEGPDDVVSALAEFGRSSAPLLTERFQKQADKSSLVQAEAVKKPDVPKWRDRTTGRKVSPVEWIKLHYGEKLENNELTRSDLLADKELYQAYATWIKRNPESDLNLPKTTRRATLPNDEAAERRRASSRASYHRRKKL